MQIKHGSPDTATSGVNPSTGPAAGPSPGAAPGPDLGAAPSFQAPGGGGFDAAGIFMAFASRAGLGPQGDQHLESLIKMIQQRLPNAAVESLMQPGSARAIIAGDAVYVVVYTERLPARSDPLLPFSNYVDAIADSLKKLNRGKLRLINFVLVPPADYIRVNQLANDIANCLTVANRPELQALTVDQLGGQQQYVVDTSLDAARAIFAQEFPHSVLPPMHLGAVVSIKQAGARRDLAVRGLQEETSIPVLAVGLLVDFRKVTNAQGQTVFQPLLRVTGLHSALPIPAMVLMGIAVAGMFAVNGQWMTGFNSFVRGQPNIGNLLRDPNDAKGAPFMVQNSEELVKFVNMNCLPPQVVVDVVEGQARIPALAHLLQGSEVGREHPLVADFASFFGTSPAAMVASVPAAAQALAQPVIPTENEFIGTIGHAPGPQEDSRVFTYLYAMAQRGGDDFPALQTLLLFQRDNPKPKAELISQLTGSFTSTHLDALQAISPAFVDLLSASFRNRMQLIQTSGGQYGNYANPLANFGAITTAPTTVLGGPNLFVTGRYFV